MGYEFTLQLGHTTALSSATPTSQNLKWVGGRVQFDPCVTICNQKKKIIKKILKKKTCVSKFNLLYCNMKCTKCNQEKDLSEFYKGHRSCKECHKKCVIASRKKKPEKYKEYHKKKSLEWARANKEKHNSSSREWRKNNPEKHRKSAAQWKKNNPDKVKAAKKRYREKVKNDPLKLMRRRIRSRTLKAFKANRWYKSSRNEEMLGCTWEEAFSHIESKFSNGMSWDNMGEWHIDHEIPLASAKTEEELIRLCRFDNLQPLWAEDNLKKGSKIISK